MTESSLFISYFKWESNRDNLKVKHFFNMQHKSVRLIAYLIYNYIGSYSAMQTVQKRCKRVNGKENRSSYCT